MQVVDKRLKKKYQYDDILKKDGLNELTKDLIKKE